MVIFVAGLGRCMVMVSVRGNTLEGAIHVQVEATGQRLQCDVRRERRWAGEKKVSRSAGVPGTEVQFHAVKLQACQHGRVCTLDRGHLRWPPSVVANRHVQGLPQRQVSGGELWDLACHDVASLDQALYGALGAVGDLGADNIRGSKGAVVTALTPPLPIALRFMQHWC